MLLKFFDFSEGVFKSDFRRQLLASLSGNLEKKKLNVFYIRMYMDILSVCIFKHIFF